MKKIAIVMSEGLPVPAVKGGAVENLVQALLDENEKAPAFAFSVFTLADPLAEQAAKKYAHARFHFFPKKKARLFRWISKHLLPAPFYFGDPFIRDVLGAMRGNAFDAIVIENAPRYAMPLRKAFPRTPIACHLHNRILRRGCRYERQIVRATDAFACVSEFLCREAFSARGVLRRRVFCCPNGIDVARFSSAALSAEERASRRAQFGLSEKDFVFLFSGRIVKEKGVGELLEAFREVGRRVPAAKLLLLGANVVEEGTAKWDAPVPRGVVFSGLVPYAEMPAMLKLGDVAVLPSTGDEAFPLTLVECLCAGLPTISTDSGGMAEIAEGGAARVVPRGKDLSSRLAEAMLALHASAEERRALSEKGASRGALFSRERYWARFREILSTLVSFRG